MKRPCLSAHMSLRQKVSTSELLNGFILFFSILGEGLHQALSGKFYFRPDRSSVVYVKLNITVIFFFFHENGLLYTIGASPSLYKG